jgi:hypothetical protein
MIEKTGNKCDAKLPQRELRHETGELQKRSKQPERYTKSLSRYSIEKTPPSMGRTWQNFKNVV